MFQKKLFVMVSLLVIIAMIAGCTAPAAAPTTAPAQPTAAPAQPTAVPAQPTGGDEKYVGFVPPALTSPFHVAMSDGAKAAADAAGWKLEVQAPASEGDFQAFVTTVQQLLE
ncbi:MAG: hypothetical protein HGB05_10650, partial [Chloroflexi bacterium]|nr:hypothetical protein [Chloroflexota bacterium]